MILFFSILAGSVLLDQLSKWLAVVFLQAQPSVPLWREVLHLTFHTNKGAAWGILADNRWVFMVFSTVAIVGILYYVLRYRPKNPMLLVSLSMIAGGGIGNMIDRIFLGYVIDFIDFTLIDFPIFNIADSFVCVGAGMMMLYLVLDIVREYKKERAEKAVRDRESGDV
ncbi:MAG: signal peptidase II [Clostridia bacterium]|nr:signal peptidase II [Clostridia bacterium]